MIRVNTLKDGSITITLRDDWTRELAFLVETLYETDEATGTTHIESWNQAVKTGEEAYREGRNTYFDKRERHKK